MILTIMLLIAYLHDDDNDIANNDFDDESNISSGVLEYSDNIDDCDVMMIQVLYDNKLAGSIAFLFNPVSVDATLCLQGRKFMSCSHCQELGQQASWLLIGCTRVNSQSEARLAC